MLKKVSVASCCLEISTHLSTSLLASFVMEQPYPSGREFDRRVLTTATWSVRLALEKDLHGGAMCFHRAGSSSSISKSRSDDTSTLLNGVPGMESTCT